MDFVCLEDPWGKVRVLFAPDVVAPPRASRPKGHEIPRLVEAFGDGAKGWPREVCPLHDYHVEASLGLRHHLLGGGW